MSAEYDEDVQAQSEELHQLVKSGNLHELLRKGASAEDIQAAISNHPGYVRIVDEKYFRLPIQVAIENKCSLGVQKALLDAYSPEDETLLQVALTNGSSVEVVLALLEAYPLAAIFNVAKDKTRGSDGMLPLIFAVENALSDKLVLGLLKAYTEGAKIRYKGHTPLGIALMSESSDDVVLAILKAYPKAAEENVSNKCDVLVLPLHFAVEEERSEKVKDALLHAYPGARLCVNPLQGILRLHQDLRHELKLDYVEKLIEMNPKAASTRGLNGRLPLHDALEHSASEAITDSIILAYKEAIKERMEDGRLPIEVCAENNFTAHFLTKLLDMDMPLQRDGKPRQHGGSWNVCVASDIDVAAEAVKWILENNEEAPIDENKFAKHIHHLADVRDGQGRSALAMASSRSRDIIYKYLLFCGRYKLQIGPPEHRTATSVVLRAQDLGEQADYGAIFDDADKDGNEKLDKGEILELVVSKIGLDPELFLKGSDAISKEDFIGICKRQLGDCPREVVIKLMKNKDQWERECNARTKNTLHPKYVVSALSNVPSEDVIAKAVERGEGGLDTMKEKFLDDNKVGKYAIVMGAGPRNLHQIFYQEQPKIDAVRDMRRQVFEAVKHLHEKNLMHGDIKMLNVVRFRIDNGLRLIDFDAAARIVPPGGAEESFAGAKFSSAILPPEMIERIVTEEQLEKFNKYWEGEKDEAQVKKVAPKLYQEPGKLKAHYVVKSFRTEEGKPVDTGLLPHKLVRASESIDLWSLGVLAFTLFTGETLIPSTRDDDCASGAAMHLLHSWEKQHTSPNPYS